MDQGEPNSSILTTNNSCGSLGNTKLQAQFLESHSQILSLENEIDILRVRLSEEKIKKGSFYVTEAKDNQLLERCHKLEQERTQLNEEIASLKKECHEAVRESTAQRNKCRDLQHQHAQQLQTLQQQLYQVEEDKALLEKDKLQLQLDLHNFQTREQTQQSEELQALDGSYIRSMTMLRSRLRQLEDVERKLSESNAEVKKLQRQLRLSRQDNLFVDQMKTELQTVQELQQQLQTLRHDNQRLQQDRVNSDLLRYQVHDLQKKCESVEALSEEVAQLRQQNTQLRVANKTVASEAKDIELAELQQREIIAAHECGILATQLSESQRKLSLSQDELYQVQSLLDKQKLATSTLEDRVHRLDRRLQFVTKERDGCVNVLSSYKQDGGVDALVKEWLTELRYQLDQRDKRISELEADL